MAYSLLNSGPPPRFVIFQEQIHRTELIYPQSDSELLVESYSEGEEEPTNTNTLRRLASCNIPDDTMTPVAAVEIRSLIERKEELERRQRKQDRHRQRVQVSVSRARNTLQRSRTQTRRG